MKGTRLWQAPGSPIIQGMSKTQRPLWQSWMIALGISVIAATAFAASASYGTPDLWRDTGLSALAALLGSLFGVSLARGLGWRTAWIWGALIGSGAAILTMAAVAPVSSLFAGVFGVRI